MKFSEVQTTRRVYQFFLNRLNNKMMSSLCEKIVLSIFYIVYLIRVLFVKEHKEDEINCQDVICKKNRVINEYKRINEKSIDLSILIPVYNVEPFLKECLDSIIKQDITFTYEVICINDGSTDKSLKILEEYENNKNFKIISQNNKGIAETRNILLENARGRYVFFIDSDDIIEKDAINTMMKMAIEEDIDLLQTSYYVFNSSFKRKIELSSKNNRNYNMLIPGFVWGKLMKAELFKKVYFPSRIFV